MRAFAGFACTLALSACASPATSFDGYQGKVAASAQAMTGIVNTAWLAADSWQRHRVTSAYADIVVTNAERDAGSVLTALDTRQPPDERSIALKDDADQPLQDASDALTDLRIALRRDDHDGVSHAMQMLKHELQPLAAFTQDGG